MIPLFTRLLEKIAANFPSSTKMFTRYYQPIIEEEIRLGEITEKDKILFIGGGAIPATAYGIAQRTKAEIDVVEMDQCAVKFSKRLTKKLGLDHNIKILQADGEKVATKGYSVVIIALQACPHKEILKNALLNSDEGTKVIIRCPIHGLQGIYGGGLPDVECHAASSGERVKANMKGSLLFIVNKYVHKTSMGEA